MLIDDIFFFTQIRFQVVKLQWFVRGELDRLPIAHPDRLLEAALVKFPVQKLVLIGLFGRQPKTVLNEPRPLDLDLIAFRHETRGPGRLTLPHPRAHLRRFVLQPLSEIASDLLLPGQVLNVRQLLETLDSSERLLRLR